MTRLVSGEDRIHLGSKLLKFANQWMNFVSDKCERGRGLRPRSASLVSVPRYYLAYSYHFPLSVLNDDDDDDDDEKRVLTPHCQNACIGHYHIYTFAHMRPRTFISDFENIFSNSHSHDEFLCHFSFKSSRSKEIVSCEIEVTDGQTDRHTDGRTDDRET